MIFLPPLISALLPIAASSANGKGYAPCKAQCLTDGGVNNIMKDFKIVVGKSPGYQDAAARVVAEDFTSISDSLSFVDQLPLNTTMTRSRSQLLEQESKLPPVGEIKDLFLSYTCDTITWYFEFATKPLPTRGIAILFVGLETKQIYKAYREANVGAVLKNVGNPECKGGWSTSVGDEGVEYVEASCGTE